MTSFARNTCLQLARDEPDIDCPIRNRNGSYLYFTVRIILLLPIHWCQVHETHIWCREFEFTILRFVEILQYLLTMATTPLVYMYLLECVLDACSTMAK